MKLILWFLFAFIHSEWRYVVACSNLIDISKAYIIKIRCNIFFYYVRYSIYQFPFSVSVSQKIKKWNQSRRHKEESEWKIAKVSSILRCMFESFVLAVLKSFGYFFFLSVHAYMHTRVHKRTTYTWNTYTMYVCLLIHQSFSDTNTKETFMYVYERFRHILKLFKLTNDYISVEIKREKRRKENNTERKLEENWREERILCTWYRWKIICFCLCNIHNFCHTSGNKLLLSGS